MNHGMLPVAILAGGVAMRLRPLTQTIPKALIDVNGEPFIAHQLRLLRANGIERVIVCTGYLDEMIQSYIGDGVQFGLQVGFLLMALACWEPAARSKRPCHCWATPSLCCMAIPTCLVIIAQCRTNLRGAVD